MDFCSLWITRSLFVLAITTVIYWTGVLLELFTLEVTSTWKSTSCSGFSILTFSSLNRFLAAMLLYNSGLNGFNVTSWRMAQQGWVAGSLYPFWTRGCPSLHTLFPSVLHMETYNLISTASDWQLWGSYNIISTASVWQLWSQTFQCDLYDRHRWWYLLELHICCDWTVQPIVTGVKKKSAPGVQHTWHVSWSQGFGCEFFVCSFISCANMWMVFAASLRRVFSWVLWVHPL